MTEITYEVIAHKLTVSSGIPIDIDTAWEKAQAIDLLIFITDGIVKLKPTDGRFLQTWKEGDTVSTRMLVKVAIGS